MKQRWAIVLGIVIIMMVVIGHGLPGWAAPASSNAPAVHLPLVMRDDPWGPHDPTPTLDLPPWFLTPTPTLNDLALQARAHEDRFVALINETRRREGRRLQVVDTPCLKAAAQRHARDLAVDPENRYWDNGHRGSDGSWPRDRAIEAGCPERWGVGEILTPAIAAEDALLSFSTSPLHWWLASAYGNRIGVAFEPVFFGGFNWYFVVAVLAADSELDPPTPVPTTPVRSVAHPMLTPTPTRTPAPNQP